MIESYLFATGEWAKVADYLPIRQYMWNRVKLAASAATQKEKLLMLNAAQAIFQMKPTDKIKDLLETQGHNTQEALDRTEKLFLGNLATVANLDKRKKFWKFFLLHMLGTVPTGVK